MPRLAFKKDDFFQEDVVHTQYSHDTVGLQLKAAREERGETLESISKVLRISEFYLQALENDDRESLPEIVYTIGFLRTYALYLSLDATQLIKAFKQQFTQSIHAEDLVFPVPTAQRSIPSRAIVLLSLALVSLIFISWLVLKPSSQAVDEFQHLSPVESTSNPSVDADIEDQPLSEPDVKEEGSSPAVISGPQADFSQARPIFPVADTRPRQETLAKKIVMNEKGIFLGPGKEISLHAKEDCWVEFKKENGQIVLSKTLKEGDSESIDDISSLTFSTGNAAGISFYVDGKYFVGLGEKGEVIKNKKIFLETLPESSSSEDKITKS